MSAAKDLFVALRVYLASRTNDQRLSDFTTGLEWTMAERPLPPRSLPVVDVLAAVAPLANTAEQALISALAGAAPALAWGQTYSASDFGVDFLAKYGWVEMFGTRGHFACDRMAGGFLLLGPDIDYPDHHHIAEEIYIPLSDGSLWSRGGGSFALRHAGEIIHHPSDIDHAMRTADRPLVALYLWRGGSLAQKSVIVQTAGG